MNNTPSSIRLVVGLGNPGVDYAATRHNAGAWLVQALAKQHNTYPQNNKAFFGEVTKFKWGKEDVWLLIPSTYMNRSGQAVVALASFYKISPDQILVAHDELDLMPGTAKLKFSGGSAGHNGLKDISTQLGNPNYWRLRIGIGHPRTLNLTQNVADFVLHRPNKTDLQSIEHSIKQTLKILPELLNGQPIEAMKQLHTKINKTSE